MLSLVGAHGGGFYNHIFCAKDTFLLELQHTEAIWTYFHETAGMLGQRYAVLEYGEEWVEEYEGGSQGPGSGMGGRERRGMVVNVPEVIAVLSANIGLLAPISDPKVAPIRPEYDWRVKGGGDNSGGVEGQPFQYDF